IVENGLRESGGRLYPFLTTVTDARIPDFLSPAALSAAGKISREMYDTEASEQFYQNFKAWLFRTFGVVEQEFRSALIDRLRLKPGSRVLVTGCGLGDDVHSVLDALKGTGEVFASDIAPEMVLRTHRSLVAVQADYARIVSLSVCDACRLPFPDCSFDAAFHFGGINLFEDMRGTIGEMARVTRDGGR